MNYVKMFNFLNFRLVNLQNKNKIVSMFRKKIKEIGTLKNVQC